MYSPNTSYQGQPNLPLPQMISRPVLPSFLGSNAIFASMVPFLLTTAIQYNDAQHALIAGAAVSGFLIIFGLILYYLEARQVRIYILEVALLVVTGVQLAVSYIKYKQEIADNLNFITNGGLALISMASIVVGYPFTLQYVREMVPRPAWRHGSLNTVAFFTSSGFVLVFVTNTLLYIIPVAKDLLGSPPDALNYVFRIILPIVFFFFAILALRMAPAGLDAQVQASAGFDDSAAEEMGWPWTPGVAGVTKVMVNPLAQP